MYSRHQELKQASKQVSKQAPQPIHELLVATEAVGELPSNRAPSVRSSGGARVHVFGTWPNTVADCVRDLTVETFQFG